jgi:hypothetical protein
MEAVARLGEAGLLVLSWWCLALLQGIDHYSGTFLFAILFFVVCICIATRTVRCCRGWCNLYLLNINKWSYKKNYKLVQLQ